MTFTRVLMAAAALALATACGGAQDGSGGASAPAPTPAQPAAPVSAPRAAASATAPAVAPSTEGRAAASRFAIVAEATEARFHVTEQLAGLSLPNEAVGKTKSVSGAILVAPDGTVLPDRSKVTVDMASLTSDSAQRDNYIRRNTLQVSQFPTAEFVPRAIEGLPTPFPTSGEVRFRIAGDLTVRGVTQPVTWDVTAQAGPEAATGRAVTTVKFEQFGMTPPKVGRVLSIDDKLRLELDFRVERNAA